jgi:hypothetical protein
MLNGQEQKDKRNEEGHCIFEGSVPTVTSRHCRK